MRIISLCILSLLACACASWQTRQRVEAASTLYVMAARQERCIATHHLFKADLDYALPVFFRAVELLQEEERYATSEKGRSEYADIRLFIFARVTQTYLMNHPAEWKLVMMRWCQDPSDQVRQAGMAKLHQVALNSNRCFDVRMSATALELVEQIRKKKAEPIGPANAAPPYH